MWVIGLQIRLYQRSGGLLLVKAIWHSLLVLKAPVLARTIPDTHSAYTSSPLASS